LIVIRTRDCLLAARRRARLWYHAYHDQQRKRGRWPWPRDGDSDPRSAVVPTWAVVARVADLSGSASAFIIVGKLAIVFAVSLCCSGGVWRLSQIWL